jgi:hypothetical protein
VARQPVPKRIAEAPQLLPGLGFYYTAFLTLSSCRSVGFSEGRIPWTAARDYANQLDMTDEELEDLWMLVCSMDGEYLKYRAEQAAKKTK